MLKSGCNMPGRRVSVPSILRTHPETRERIARLMALKPELVAAGVSLTDKAGFDRRSGFGDPVVRPPRRHISGLGR